jgi:hypothetical protein
MVCDMLGFVLFSPDTINFSVKMYMPWQKLRHGSVLHSVQRSVLSRD